MFHFNKNTFKYEKVCVLIAVIQKANLKFMLELRN